MDVITLTLMPGELRLLDNVQCREWTGFDDQGCPVVAYIRAVVPQTHDEQVAKRYGAQLNEWE